MVHPVLRLKRIRQDLGLSQEEVARRSGVSTSSVVRAEKVGDVNVKTLRRIAEGLGVPVTDLFGTEA
jgi:transcriptional regulator with XRE-family HTH domain